MQPLLFLSHSGAQKDFTRRLYSELLRVKHNPFFDQDAQDSLPKGTPFPSRIVEACRACKLGIIVLSHEFVESLWPMLELQQLLFHDPSSSPVSYKVYPLFYKLKPADLSDEDNLRRWRSAWDKHAPSWHEKLQDLHMASSGTYISPLQPMLDINLWPRALAILRSQSGDVLRDGTDEHAFIQLIVSNICQRFPPPNPFQMGDQFKGAHHMQQKIHELFQQQQQRDEEIGRPSAVGVYGVGGSGKTTLCKYMINFYNKEYPGRCYFLEFPTTQKDESKLVKSMKKSIPESLINSVEQAMPDLQQLLKRYMVFMVLDNVWDWALQIAKQIVTLDYTPGSRLLVTSRSAGVLKHLRSSKEIQGNEAIRRLPTMQIVPIPSISEEEAIDALMAYGFSSHFLSREDLRHLARSCFFDEKCHPLLLTAMGAKLRHLGGCTRTAQDSTQLISRLQAHHMHADDEEIEDMVLNVLKVSFDALSSKLQKTFLHLGMWVGKSQRTWRDNIWVFEEDNIKLGWVDEYRTFASDFSNKITFLPLLDTTIEWLSMLGYDSSNCTAEDIRDQLIQLEYHGLIQIDRDEVTIHDLLMKLIDNIVLGNNGAPRCFLFEGDVATLSASDWRRLRYIHGFMGKGTDLTVLNPERRWMDHINGVLPVVQYWSLNCPNIVVLQLEGYSSGSWWHAFISQRLCLEHMQSLRYLELDALRSLEAVGGWHGAPNLVSVKLTRCHKLRKIESMAPLCKLECLIIQDFVSTNQNYVTNLSSSSQNLKRLVMQGNLRLQHLGYDLPKLQELDLSGCKNLVHVESLAACTSLRRCNLGDTGISKFPDCKLIKLEKLQLSFCKRLRRMEGSVCGHTALRVVCVNDCQNLESIPDLEFLVELRQLHLRRCYALKEVKLGDMAVTGLEELSLQYSCVLKSAMSCSPLPIRHFSNLRQLWASGERSGIRLSIIDVGNTLPLSLERLCLTDFESAFEIRGLSSLVHLRCLWIERCPSLTTLTGLDGLSRLHRLKIVECPSLKEVDLWEAPSRGGPFYEKKGHREFLHQLSKISIRRPNRSRVLAGFYN